MRRARPLIVVALGGNALLRRGEPADSETQRRNVKAAAGALARLAAQYDLVVTHGNGPQVGLLAREAALDPEVHPYPLDVLDAESEGMIGYLLVQALHNAMPERQVAAILTQVVVDPDDPGFLNPSKPIGPVYSEPEALALARRFGWQIALDGQLYRRVVPSPRPRRIVEIEIVEHLLERGVLVVCVGGGGIPVVERDGRLEGVEAVIDKDWSAALLARSIGADFLLMLTDVDAVQRGWGTPAARSLHQVTSDELDPADFAAGSMRPKIEAAIEFTERSGGTAAIGSLQHAREVVQGVAGTTVRAAWLREPERTAALAATRSRPPEGVKAPL
jgi:carbamate kinase